MAFDTGKFETIHQVGGIRTGRYDWPDAGGSPGCRVALVDTGSGLRFTIPIDRGGDIVEAFYHNSSLAYLTPSGRGLVLDVTGDAQNMAHIGLLNRSLGFAVELNYSTESLPCMANWQHFGLGGVYISALQPFIGSLFGKQQDPHPLAAQWLDAGQSRKYEMNIIVHPDEAAISGLLAHDGDLVPVHP